MFTLVVAPSPTAAKKGMVTRQGSTPRRVLSVVTALLLGVAGVSCAENVLQKTEENRSATRVISGRIALATNVQGRWQIFTVQTDGTLMTPLTDLATDQFHPAWSPDGTKIAFDAQDEAGMQIGVMEADGSNLQMLTAAPGWNYLPAWSPDGARIAFVSNRDGNDEIYVMNADGSGQERLTSDPDEDLSPDWAPDGTKIAFQSNREGRNQIYVMNTDSSGVTTLTNSEGFDPAWSADGTRIAFASTRDGNPEIYIMDAQGSSEIRLTHDPSHDWNPIWSPDGSSIAFESDRDGDVGIYLMTLDGTDPYRLLTPDSQACCPSWQPMAAEETIATPGDEPSSSAPPVPEAPPAAEPTPFVPSPMIDGEEVRLEMTWPDGSVATLVYAAELDLGSGGIQPDISYAWSDDPPADHPIVFLHGPPGVEAGFVEGEPLAMLPITGGGVTTLWAAAGSQFTRHRDIDWWLVYRTDTWSILVSLHQRSNANEVATSLVLAESAGFPFVSTMAPLSLAEGFGESGGPVLGFGDANAVPDLVSDLLGGTIFLSPDGCSGGPEFDPEELDYYGSNCLGDGSVFASIYGDPVFIRAVLQGVRIVGFSR